VYEGIQSAGGAVFWSLDANKKGYDAIFGASVRLSPFLPPRHFIQPITDPECLQWGLLAGSLLFAAPIIWLKIKDTTDIEEDLKFSDETIVDVAPTSMLAQEKTAEV
jgi:hypothetical protein